LVTPDRFTLEDQVLRFLEHDERTEWRRWSDTLRRTLLLAGGFMDVEVIVRNIREIIALKRK